jgi:hypothetical protein
VFDSNLRAQPTTMDAADVSMKRGIQADAGAGGIAWDSTRRAFLALCTAPT